METRTTALLPDWGGLPLRVRKARGIDRETEAQRWQELPISAGETGVGGGSRCKPSPLCPRFSGTGFSAELAGLWGWESSKDSLGGVGWVN